MIHLPGTNAFEKYLMPTKLIESSHPAIIAKARELSQGTSSAEEQARNIFYFVRDKIRYEFKAKYLAEQYHASYILQNRKGFCTQKAILFCALARSCGIPAGLFFYDIVDYMLPKRMVMLMKTNRLYYHGIVTLQLNGAWQQLDATLHRELVQRNNLPLVEYVPNQDCLIPARTNSGEKYIEYVKNHGLFADISFEQIIQWFLASYPHLIKKYVNPERR